MSSFDGIAALLEKHRPPDRPRLPPADEIRLAATRAAFKRKSKRELTPKYVIANMARWKAEGRTVPEIGAMVGRCTSDIYYLFKQHGVLVTKRNQRPALFHNGVKYAFDGKHYFQTTKDRQGIALHKVIWEEKNGSVPAGHRLVLCGTPHEIENVRLMPLREFYRYMVAKREAKRRAMAA